jgi:uncharacterized protein YdeI (YjbR/CyaY-like superfamily)
VHVTIERDSAERTVDVPHDLAAALEQAGLTARFAAMAYSHRRQHVEAINEAKRLDTRARRIEKAVRAVAAVRDG